MSSPPIAWTIAGSDSSAGAGIQADLKTMQSLSVYCASVITSVTAQNTQRVSAVANVSEESINDQIAALRCDLPPAAIKIGMLGALPIVQAVTEAIKSMTCPVVYDPVMVATSGDALVDSDALQSIRENLVPLATLVTPNWYEAHILAERGLVEPSELPQCELPRYIESLASDILARGAQSVLLKGGHLSGDFAQDFWTDGKTSAWLTSNRQCVKNTHGTGCTLSSAIAASLAKGIDVLDALVIAKAYVNQGLRLAPGVGSGNGPLAHTEPDFREYDLPWLTQQANVGQERPEFSRDGSIGFYPIVPDNKWLELVAAAGAKTVQLRIKNKSLHEVEDEVISAVNIANRFNCNLYINDYWRLAIKHKAYGVHLGQEDIVDADIEAISQSNLRLGISTHCYAEVARALAVRPSYIAIGPVFPTTTKVMRFFPQGLDALSKWSQMLTYPLVAIGGITFELAKEASSHGASGLAVVRDIVDSSQPSARVQEWMRLFPAVQSLPVHS